MVRFTLSTDPVSVVKRLEATAKPNANSLSTDPASVEGRLDAMPEPLYTAANCTPAYELRWSLALFATAELPRAGVWLSQLGAAVERDGVRVLEHRCRPPAVCQFLVSTTPEVAPPQIVKSVKGRLQHWPTTSTRR